jgi:hypothetical protein
LTNESQGRSVPNARDSPIARADDRFGPADPLGEWLRVVHSHLSFYFGALGIRHRERCYNSIGPPTMRLSRNLPIAPSLKPSTSASTSSVCSPSTGARRGLSRETDENSSGEPGTR